MSETQMYWGHISSVVIAFLMLGIALRWREAGRVAYAGLFLWASQVNLRIALFRPDDYQGFAALTWSDWYRGFITGWFADHASVVIAAIAIGQLAAGVLITMRGNAARLGLAGGIVFLLAIVPLGVGSAFPSTVIAAAGAAWLMRTPFAASMWKALGSHVSTRMLLACGVLSSLVYVGNDLLHSALYPDYSMLDQAISELSATGAPTKSGWEAIGWVYSALMLAFSFGVLRATDGSRMVRRTGWLLLVFALSGPVWSLVPMHERGAVGNWQDAGHIVLSVASVALIALFMGVGAFTRGTAFRWHSFASLLLMLALGAATFTYAPRIAANEPTRWMGLFERASLYLYLLWVAVFSVALLPRERSAGSRAMQHSIDTSPGGLMRHTSLLAAALLFASPALAQRFEPFGLEVRPVIGAFVPLGEHRDDFRNATMLGAQGALELNEFFHLVANVSWTHGHTRASGFRTDLTHIWQYDAGMELGRMLEASSVVAMRPFLGLGGGGRTYDYRDAGAGSATCTAGYGSLGTELQRDMLALRLEGRAYATCYESRLTARQETRYDAALLLGVTYHFR